MTLSILKKSSKKINSKFYCIYTLGIDDTQQQQQQLLYGEVLNGIHSINIGNNNKAAIEVKTSFLIACVTASIYCWKVKIKKIKMCNFR